MLLPRFALHAPRTVGEAVDLLARHGEEATVYAGGTELLLAMKLRVLRYGHLIDVKRIPGLAEIAVRDGALALGALATHYALERHPLVARHLPAYAALSRAVANVRVRVAGTLGGNLCFAEPHADPPALLAALGAAVRLAGPDGERDVRTSRQPDRLGEVAKVRDLVVAFTAGRCCGFGAEDAVEAAEERGECAAQPDLRERQRPTALREGGGNGIGPGRVTGRPDVPAEPLLNDRGCLIDALRGAWTARCDAHVDGLHSGIRGNVGILSAQQGIAQQLRDV